METEEGIHHRGRRVHREDWEWESDSDGGLGHLVCPSCAAATWRCVPALPGTCGGGELGRVVPSWSEVDGAPVLPGQAAKNPADARLDAASRLEARELEREYQGGLG
jgi:hypothetical protein